MRVPQKAKMWESGAADSPSALSAGGSRWCPSAFWFLVLSLLMTMLLLLMALLMALLSAVELLDALEPISMLLR